MLRIQLVIEEYGELISLQTMLKKLGFDVDATQNTVGLSDQLLTLNPDLVIMTAFGRKVVGFDFVKQIRRVRGQPNVILLFDPAVSSPTDPGVASWMSSPVDREELIELIAKLYRLNQTVLLEKYRRHLGQEVAAEGGVEIGPLRASTLGDEERRARYREFLKVEPPPTHGFTANLVREQVKVLRQAEARDDQADLERERREFVAHLFKKGS